MADVKISALPAATTPLAGTEVLPIVQSATTKQVSIANVTAGRAISASSLTLTTPLSVANGGTGLTSLTSGYIPYGNGTGAFSSSSGLQFDGSNLGLGVTPSASWQSTRRVVQVGSNAALWGINSGTGTLFLSNNTYYDGTDFRYLNTGNAAYYSQAGAGSHAWFTAPSGTAGNPISFTQAMTLDASGRLFLGATTGIGNDRMLIVTDSSTTYTQCLNLKDSYASANGTNFIVCRKSDDTYMGAIKRSSTDNALAVDGNSYLAFQTGGTERARIDSSGNLLVGTTPALARFVSRPASSSVIAGWFSPGASGDLSTEGIRVDKFDNNTTTSQVFIRFSLNNNITASGQINANGASAAAFGTWSDARLKENIAPLPSQLSNILALNPSEFDYRDGSGHQIGFIAQEMQEVYPDVVGEGNDGMLTITGWSKTEARLVSAIQELAAKVSALEAKQ